MGLSPDARAAILRRSHVRVSGQGRDTIVFAHGFGCDQRMWRFVAPHFEATHRVVLFDHIGCGRSDLAAYDDERHGSLEGYASDVLDILDALELERCTLVGHSISSTIGMMAARRSPGRFERLVLLAPSPRFVNEPSSGYVGGFEAADIEGMLELMQTNHFGWASFLAPLVMHETNPAPLTEELESSLCALEPRCAQRFARITFFSDSRALLPEVTVPALVVQCTDDAIAPRHIGRYLCDRLPAATLVEIEAAGHCPHMSHPDLTIAAIEGYLRTGC